MPAPMPAQDNVGALALASAGDVKDTKAFCMAPWVNLTVAIGGVAAPCCEIKGKFGDAQKQTLLEIWHGGEFRALRQRFLRDEKTPRCWKCYEIDDAGGRSMRRDYNNRFAARSAALRLSANEAETLKPSYPVDIDIRFSNLCNFSCRMCWLGASSKWHSDAVAMGWSSASSALIKSFASVEGGIASVDPLLETVENIYWAGGEPLLIEEHYTILERLLKLGRSDVSLRYNTNCSELRLGPKHIIPLWRQFRNVHLGISIDGTEQRGELIRKGLVWERFVENLAEIRAQCPHVEITYGITVSVFNIFALDELHQRLAQLRFAGIHDFHMHPVQQPEYCRITILPPDLKKAIAERLTLYGQKIQSDPEYHEPAHKSVPGRANHQFDYIVAFMLSEDRSDLIPEFKAVTRRIDALRGENTASVCPELAGLLAD